MESKEKECERKQVVERLKIANSMRSYCELVLF